MDENIKMREVKPSFEITEENGRFSWKVKELERTVAVSSDSFSTRKECIMDVWELAGYIKRLNTDGDLK